MQATFFSPFATSVRVMVTVHVAKKALDTLKEVWFSLNELYDGAPGEFLFFNKMKAPVRRIQSKFRYQVLMRLREDKLLDEIYSRASRYS
mgnify:CR=1 FL=1